MYKRSQEHQHQFVVPKALVQDIIKANHNPVYIGHPRMKRTFDLISLRYWWPSMRQLSCDPCQRRKENREFVAVDPLWGHSHRRHWAVSSYPGGNKFLLTFIDGFSKYVENRSRPIIRFCIFQRNLQNSGNQKSKHHQFPSGLQWNGGEIPSILTFRSLPLYWFCKH